MPSRGTTRLVFLCFLTLNAAPVDGLSLDCAFGGTPPSRKQQLDQLLAAYKAYGLPLPPADSILVRYRYQPSWTTAAGTKPAAKHGLAFLLKARRPTDEAEVLSGLWRSPRSEYEKVEPVDPDPVVLAGLDDLNALALAVQCQARGWHELSQALFERVRMDSAQPAEIELAREAWGFWSRDLTNADVDWSKTARQLRIILEREPKAFEAYHGALLQSMELALKQSDAKAGSIDAMLDSFIAASTRTTLLREATTSAAFVEHAGLSDDPRYIKIARLGFEAVPALIARLNDDRLTRIRIDGYHFPGYQCRIRHIVSDLLEDLAGVDLGRDSTRRLGGHSVDRAKAERWWKDASRLGEEKYLLHHTVGDSPTAEQYSRLMLDIIAAKYPQHLPMLYRKILNERPKLSSTAVAAAIARSDMSKVEQRELFLTAAESKNMDRRCEGLWYLPELDRKKFDAILIASIGEIEGTPLGYDDRFARLAQETANPEVWDALQGVAARAFPPARQGYLDAVGNQEHGKPGAKGRLRFLTYFLNDATPGRYRCEFGTLQISNNAARNLALALEMKIRPEANWTDAQWARLRAEVKAALERMEL